MNEIDPPDSLSDSPEIAERAIRIGDFFRRETSQIPVTDGEEMGIAFAERRLAQSKEKAKTGLDDNEQATQELN